MKLSTTCLTLKNQPMPKCPIRLQNECKTRVRRMCLNATMVMNTSIQFYCSVASFTFWEQRGSHAGCVANRFPLEKAYLLPDSNVLALCSSLPPSLNIPVLTLFYHRYSKLFIVLSISIIPYTWSLEYLW